MADVSVRFQLAGDSEIVLNLSTPQAIRLVQALMGKVADIMGASGGLGVAPSWPATAHGPGAGAGLGQVAPHQTGAHPTAAHQAAPQPGPGQQVPGPGTGQISFVPPGTQPAPAVPGQASLPAPGQVTFAPGTGQVTFGQERRLPG